MELAPNLGSGDRHLLRLQMLINIVRPGPGDPEPSLSLVAVGSE